MRNKAPVVVVIGLFLVAALGAAYVATANAQAAKPGESVITYDDASYAAEQGAVTFSHPAHKEAYGKEKLDCVPCHMKPPPLFPMKKRKEGEARTAMKMAEMAEGKFCGTCHNGKTEVNGKAVFGVQSEEDCGKCHKK
jgi:c(7)-type cytochrome triheme protein